VVYGRRRRLGPQRLAQVRGELRQVVGIGAHGVGRGVALALQVAQERGDRGLHAGTGPERAGSASSERKRSRLASARSARASRRPALPFPLVSSWGSSPKGMLVGG